MIKFLILFLFISLCVNGHTSEIETELSSEKIIIDNDAGADDSMAIFLALLFEKHFNGPQVVALTTGNGNTYEDNVFHNNQRILKVARRTDIPIYRGSKKSLVITTESNFYYGKDGLGDTNDDVSNLVSAKTQSAVSALIEYSKSFEGNVTLITLGTLTNVALAITLDPGFLGRLKHLYVGAGHFDTQEAEFNAKIDPEAYRIVVQNANPDKVTIVAFSLVKEYFNITKEWRDNALGGIDSDIMENQNKFERVSLKKEFAWQKLDPAVMALSLRPDLVDEYKYSENDIILCGDRRGITTNKLVEKENANVRLAYALKKEEYKQFLLDVFGYNVL